MDEEEELYLLEDEIDQNSVSNTETSAEQIKRKFQSVSGCVFNFVNSTLGSGMLATPYILKNTGYVLGIILFICFGIMSTIQFFSLTIVSQKTGKFQYKDISEALFSKFVVYLSATSIIIFSYGCLISYVIVVRDNLFFFDEDELLYKNLVVGGLMILIIMPLCYLPSLEKLQFTSYLISVVLAYLIIVLLYIFCDKASKGLAPDSTIKPFNNDIELLFAIPMLTHSFSSQYNFMNIYKELAYRKRNITKVIILAMVFVFVVYMMLSIFGYLTYGDSTESDIFNNLAKDGDVFVYIANILMILFMVIHYPLPVYALRKSLETMLFNTESYDNRKVQMLISTVIVVSALLIGSFLKSIDNVLDFTSSLFGGMSGFIFPPLFLWRVGQRQNVLKYKVVGATFVAIGSAVTALGFGIAVYKWLVKPFLK